MTEDPKTKRGHILVEDTGIYGKSKTPTSYFLKANNNQIDEMGNEYKQFHIEKEIQRVDNV